MTYGGYSERIIVSEDYVLRLPEGLDSLLAVQAVFPLVSAREMAGDPEENEIAGAVNDRVDAGWPILAKRVRGIPEYGAAFVEAFDDVNEAPDVTIAHVANAIAAFIDAEWRSFDSPYDKGALTAGAARERLYSGEFDFIGGHYLREVNPQEVEIGVLFTPRSRRLAARTVVIVGYNEPNRELADELTGAGYQPHLIGDVRGRSSIMTAIHGAAALARAI